ncbi:cation-translocating P-type ATPase [Bosea sp. (in: a-proteobacteria)]|uniref:cation-translocating P-type ATPase n=1 Tax=Bosea sp. (in: a-proteobacteria) TaxID=1871050 RepID=UPI002614A112|nr:cation-translocating P-type ATPase [Bosea sp. (in: a-proteobacteria)]MCO5093546.1 cadmium-translocating P-type ATPase [Bosea sp. (in: a-proteobacteria)]
MSCCAPGLGQHVESGILSSDELRHAARSLGDGTAQVELSVPGVHCGACIHTVERGLSRLDGVVSARVNLSTRRVSVRFREDKMPPLAETLSGLGYPPHLFDETSISGRERTLTELLRAVAISGFAAGNVMLLSVSVWSGADGATRDLFHWVSALIALPTLAFAGRVFYRSAWNALSHGRMNMDVPIAIGVTLAYAMSLYETFNHAEHAYFDAAVTLLFFLLIGRTLDHVMRDRARSAVMGLARLAPRGAIVIAPDGSREYRPAGEIEPGTRLAIAAGERICVDARVTAGASELDCSLVNGESWPRRVEPGAHVQAGTLNLTGPLTLEATARAEDSFLAEMVRMMEAAEGGRTRYRRIADRVSSLYAPVVHLTAFLTFLGWVAIDGDWHKAITIAVAVLIITCPCALGLAVPIVQVVAARRLFERGVMVRDGSAMERLVEADTVVFDKTGTLTAGRPWLSNLAEIEPAMLAIAAGLGAHSRHPLSQAIMQAAAGQAGADDFEEISEIPGFGVEGRAHGSVWRLGRAGWALGRGEEIVATDRSGTILARDGRACAAFRFEDVPRTDAAQAIRALRQAGKAVEMLSGDTQAACRQVAENLGISRYAAALLPSEKVARIAEMAADGHRTLMVGDGLNDAPALAAAHVSMAPATAADIGRNAADFVFLHDSLEAVPFAIVISERAGQLIRQNIGLAIVYNIIAVPIAILGHVTPLIAAVAMSGSSLLVIGNALRLIGMRERPVRAARGAAAIDRPVQVERA